MFPRDQLVKAPVRQTHGFGQSPKGTQIAPSVCGSEYDEIVVQQILAAASRLRLRTMGEFGQFARYYLNAGHQREVTEAHRRYFGGSSHN
jgi:hypothetical protein